MLNILVHIEIVIAKISIGFIVGVGWNITIVWVS